MVWREITVDNPFTNTFLNLFFSVPTGIAEGQPYGLHCATEQGNHLPRYPLLCVLYLFTCVYPQWKGGQILTFIYEQCNSGDPLLRHTFQR